MSELIEDGPIGMGVNVNFREQRCLRCNNPFMSNVLIRGDDVCRTCERMNSMTFWYPRLVRSSIPTPKTIFVHADVGLSDWLESPSKYTAIMEVDRFLEELRRAAHRIGLPVFLRTEMMSNKFEWKNSCFLTSTDDRTLHRHLYSLFEASALATVDRMMDHDFFAVREMLDVEPEFKYFQGEMPIAKEVRLFVRNGKIECLHGYWPKDVFKNVPEEKVNSLRTLSDSDKQEVLTLGEFIASLFTGYWSVDLLRTKSGKWFCTDMAIGERSHHEKHKQGSD